MKSADIDRIADWIIRRGLEGAQETDLLIKFCEKCNAAGLPLARAMVIIDTLHPVHEGTVFRWRNDNVEETAATQYGRTTEGEAAASWLRSPFYHLLQTGGEELRRRIAFGDPIDFTSIQEMKDQGYTDNIIFVRRFAEGATIGEMDCVYSTWSTRDAEGFSDADIVALRRLAPTLALAIKSAVAGPGRRHPGRGLSRPRCRPARAEGTHPARRRRPHRGGRCGSPTCAASPPSPTPRKPDRDHPAAQRLCRGGHLRHPRGRRRRAEADRRRHAGDVPRRRSRRGLPPRARGGGDRAQPRRGS